MPLRVFQVSSNDAGQRADRYLRKVCPDLGLSRLHRLFRKKEIKIGKRPIDRDYLLGEGDSLQVFGLSQDGGVHARDGFKTSELGRAGDGAEFLKSRSIAKVRIPGPRGSLSGMRDGTSRPISAAGKIDMPILFEDEHLLVVNKPAGVAAHPGTGIPPGRSAIEKIWNYLGFQNKEVFQPALIHRLDRDTSGVLLAAKSGSALRQWSKLWREHRIRKTYQALVSGIPNPARGTIDMALARVDSKSGGAKSVPWGAEAKEARTDYRVVESLPEVSLVELELYTGRLHQIRAHMASLGHPLLGDDRYGDFSFNKRARKEWGVRRLALHALSLQTEWAEGGRKIVFEAPLAADLKVVLAGLRGAGQTGRF